MRIILVINAVVPSGTPLSYVAISPDKSAVGALAIDGVEYFWSIANDKAKAEEKGIRAAHGDAVSMKVQKGKTYKVQLRASDGPSIVPE